MAETRQRARPLASVVLAGVALLASLSIAELGLRLTGHRPWRLAAGELDEPVLHEPDPVLGWVNKPGTWEMPSRAPGGGPPSRVTFLPDGSRATAREETVAADRVLLVGCSVTMGFGLPDEDTFPWKLQTSHPNVRVVNYGTAAYGTYQSLLRLERELGKKPPPRLVVYGFITQHEGRNVATYDWMRGLAQHSHRGHVAIPYVSLGPGRTLVRHPPAGFPRWPLDDRLVVVSLARDAIMRLVTRGRPQIAREATLRLIDEMNRLVAARGSKLVVALLLAEEPARGEYERFLDEHGIRSIDCAHAFTDDFRIPGEGHPNGRLTSFWSQCISRNLAEELDGGRHEREPPPR